MKRLFKYQPFNTYTLRGLVTNTLWMSEPTALNDPFDSYLDDSEKPNPYTVHHIDEYFDDPRPAGKLMGQNVEIRVCSFTNVSPLAEQFSARMWSEYADAYKGVCLEFDAGIDPFSGAFKMNYDLKNRRAAILKSKPGFERELMSSTWKSRAWVAEKEWRIIRVTEDPELRYHPSALTTVWMGPRMDIRDTLILATMLCDRTPNASICELAPEPGKFRFKKSNCMPAKDWLEQNRNKVLTDKMMRRLEREAMFNPDGSV